MGVEWRWSAADGCQGASSGVLIVPISLRQGVNTPTGQAEGCKLQP